MLVAEFGSMELASRHWLFFFFSFSVRVEGQFASDGVFREEHDLREFRAMKKHDPA